MMTELTGILSEVGQLDGPVSPEPKGTFDYNSLTNKPKIMGNVLSGDKSFEDLGFPTISNSELEELLEREI